MPERRVPERRGLDRGSRARETRTGQGIRGPKLLRHFPIESKRRKVGRGWRGEGGEGRRKRKRTGFPYQSPAKPRPPSAPARMSPHEKSSAFERSELLGKQNDCDLESGAEARLCKKKRDKAGRLYRSANRRKMNPSSTCQQGAARLDVVKESLLI